MTMRESHDENLGTSSCSLNDEISVVNSLLSVVTVTSPSSDNSLCVSALPTLPLDLVEEILCRLHVKLLCQLRCICKSWNSLITDPKFAKKHLSQSTTSRIHILSRSTRRIRSSTGHKHSNLLTSYPLDSLYTNEVTNDVTQLECPDGGYSSRQDLYYSLRGSCNGILCISDCRYGFVLLCNPSLHRFKILPPLEMPYDLESYIQKSFGFGYDRVNDNYKVVAVLTYPEGWTWKNKEYNVEVKVYSLATGCWKSIGEFPFDGFPVEYSGKFVNGKIYWLIYKNWRSPCFIVSFDLENESFQEIPKPNYGKEIGNLARLGVLRDCLCMTAGHDIWLMKEYRNKEFWTKLFTVSYMPDPSKSYSLDKAIYVFEDDKVLLEYCCGPCGLDRKWIVYDPKINTFKSTKFQNKNVFNSHYYGPEIFVESLISPWS